MATRSDLVLGREQGDIVFSDDEFIVPRQSRPASVSHGNALLSDLGSSNGSFVRLVGQHALVPGEMIRLGDELLRSR